MVALLAQFILVSFLRYDKKTNRQFEILFLKQSLFEKFIRFQIVIIFLISVILSQTQTFVTQV